MIDVAIVSAARLINGKFLGSLKSLSAPDMGALVIKEALKRANDYDPAKLDEVIFGLVHQAGVRPNPARQAAVMAGVPYEVPSVTINKLCGTGLKSLEYAWQSIVTGQSEVIMVGGGESMSNVPYLLLGAREGFKMGSQTLEDSLFYDGFQCPVTDDIMGMTAENVAERFNISREDQDEYAYESQMKAVTAIKAGKFASEIFPVEIKSKKSSFIADTDECQREDITLEKLAKLRPSFKADGTVTAGNACSLSDSAAAFLVMSVDRAKAEGLRPLAVLRGFASVGLDPKIMGFGPSPAIKKLLAKTGFSLKDIGLFEINEAFASQSLAVIRDLGLNPSIVNVNGGAIAMGHPVGQSGLRITQTLIREMKERGVKYGISALCIGGGQGIAALFEVE